MYYDRTTGNFEFGNDPRRWVRPDQAAVSRETLQKLYDIANHYYTRGLTAREFDELREELGI